MKKFFSKYWIILTIIMMFVIIIFQNSCRKPELESIAISGTINNELTQASIEGVVLELYSQTIKDGIYSSGFKLVATSTTNTLGEFNFNIETNKAIAYRLDFMHADYFEKSNDLEPELLNTGNEYILDEELMPVARVEIEVHNNTPFDQNDKLYYNIVRGFSNCNKCCTNESHQITAPVYHDTTKCITNAEQYVVLQWHSEKNGVNQNHIDSFFCPSFVITKYVINF